MYEISRDLAWDHKLLVMALDGSMVEKLRLAKCKDCLDVFLFFFGDARSVRFVSAVRSDWLAALLVVERSDVLLTSWASCLDMLKQSVSLRKKLGFGCGLNFKNWPSFGKNFASTAGVGSAGNSVLRAGQRRHQSSWNWIGFRNVWWHMFALKWKGWKRGNHENWHEFVSKFKIFQQTMQSGSNIPTSTWQWFNFKVIVLWGTHVANLFYVRVSVMRTAAAPSVMTQLPTEFWCLELFSPFLRFHSLQ